MQVGSAWGGEDVSRAGVKPVDSPEAGRPAAVVMARVPAAGRVKTRLAETLGARRAAALAWSFLRDTLALVREAGLTVYLAYTPAAGAAKLARGLGGDLPAAFPQRGADLGGRMRDATHRLFSRGHAPVLVLGTDSPHLPAERLREAVDALQAADVCLGPSLDGGYYLLGSRQPCPELFRHVAWGTPLVLRQTLARAREAGLEACLLPPGFDVDTAGDLCRLARCLALDPAGTMARRTRRTLQRFPCPVVRSHP